MAISNCLCALRQITRLACSLARPNTGSSIAIKRAMMAITTSNSTSVNAQRRTVRITASGCETTPLVSKGDVQTAIYYRRGRPAASELGSHVHGNRIVTWITDWNILESLNPNIILGDELFGPLK